MSNACFLGGFGFGSMYYNSGEVGNAFGPFFPLIYKHRITGLKKEEKKNKCTAFFPPATWALPQEAGL